MLVLITEPEFRADEALLLNRMLEKHAELKVHIRKPASELRLFEQLLANIHPDFLPKLVIHQHYKLADEFPVQGIHLTTAERLKNAEQAAVSTSFHTLTEALTFQENFTYFFCSPVFPSISKPGYFTQENWDISNQTQHFRKKAVALGGINSNRLADVFQLGFRSIAVLGSIWQDNNPVEALNKLENAFSQTIITFTDSDHI